MNRIFCFLSLIVCISLSTFNNFAQTGSDKNRTHKISTNDHYKYIAINEVLMWVSNNGSGSHDPRTGGNGYYWPGGELATKSAIFQDGLMYGGKVNGQIRVNGNTHRQGLQAGKILSPGIADDPTLPKYRVYRIRKDWQSYPPGPIREELEKDYTEWPVEDGAPWEDVNGDGVFTRGTDKPKFEGDEMLWYVSNDLDTARTAFTYGSPPLGLEFQTTIYGYFADSVNLLGNVVFKKYKVINKSDTSITDMYLSYWTDDDLGDANDDYVGFDTTLQMGYTYNADNDDGGGAGNAYGFAPPAVGHIIIQAPVVPSTLIDSGFFNGRWQTGFRNLRMNATGLIVKLSLMWPRDCQQGVYDGSLEWYNLFQGLHNHGTELIDPTTSIPTKYPLCGDPVNGVGWYEGQGWPNGYSPGDRRFHIPVGPFNMSPGDTQEVVIAILISKGTTNINSVAKLKRDAQILINTYTDNFKFNGEITAPEVKTYSEENKIVLWWKDDAESFDEIDKSLMYQGLTDSTYTFEGYKLWQFKDSFGSNPLLLAIYDIENDVQQVKDYAVINGLREYITVLNSPNLGLQRYVGITRDSMNQTTLIDGTSYYFGLSTYAYSSNSYPKIIESPLNIVEVKPGKKSIDLSYTYSEGDTILMQQIEGNNEAIVKLIVRDPSALKGDNYEVVFRDSSFNYYYTFYNKTTGDTLINNSDDFSLDIKSKKIFDGLSLVVELENRFTFRNNKIKNVVEIFGPGGIMLDSARNVFEELNSTGKWMIRNFDLTGTPRPLEYLTQGGTSTDDLEIRFTAGGSEYYTTGYTFPNAILKDDPKGKGRVPFEIWDIKRNKEMSSERLCVKVFDNVVIKQDTMWSFSTTRNRWETIHGYYPSTAYAEPLPQRSGTTQPNQHQFGYVGIVGELPEPGTVIRINTYKPPVTGDVFTAVATAPTRNNFENAKQNIDKITIFPNPYFGSSTLEAGGTERIVRLTNLPQNVIVRIYSLAGVFIKRIDKDTPSPWLDWDLRNEEGSLVGSGIYLVYLDMPGIGTKVMKLAVVQSN